MAQYLDITGLSKYDELIKGFINKADSNLGKRIDAVVEYCGETNSSLAEILSIIGDVTDGKTLAGLISDLNKEDENLRKLISEIAGVDSDAGDSIASMAEIVDQLKNLQDIIGKKYIEDGDKTIINRLNDLETNGEKYKPSQSLIDIENLSSDKHGGLESQNAAWFASRGFTYSQMFDEILFPTVLPTITNPSLSWKNYSTEYDILVGTDITDLVLDSTNISAYIEADNGSWSLSTNENMTASNGCGTIRLSTTGAPINNEDGTYSMGTSNITYKAYAKFAKGDDPKDNKGNICTDKGYYTTSNVYSPTSTIYPYFNFYITTNQNTPGELVKQTVIRNAGINTITTQEEITLSPHTSNTPWKIRLPRKLQTLMMLNTLSGRYEEIPMTNIDGVNVPTMWEYKQDNTIENGIKYHTYTYIGSDCDSVNIQITF